MAKNEIDIEALNATVPNLPDNFEQWMESHMPPVPIFYRRVGKGAECQCGKCAEEYHVKVSPVRKEPALCPECRNAGFYEWKRVTRERIEDWSFSILQVTTDNKLVLRTFERRRIVKQHRTEEIIQKEVERRFFAMHETIAINGFISYYTRKQVWHKGKSRDITGGQYIYPGYQGEIAETDMKYCDTDLLRRICYKDQMNGWRLAEILTAYANNPAIEMYAKCGMDKLVRHLVSKGGRDKMIYKKGKSMQAQLRIKDKQMLKRLIKEKGSPALLQIMQYEQKHGLKWTEEQEKFAKEISAGDIRALYIFFKYMTLQQLKNRIEKYEQEKDSYGRTSAVIRYRDYLNMREELGYDMTNEIYIHPKNLRQKHDELVREKNQRKDELRTVRMNAKFAMIEKRFEKLSEKYGYETEDYFIRPAKNAGEFIAEGQYLHHCVGSSERYMERHDKGTSYIVFLRKKEEPDTPYYTIEIKKNHIVQWYSKNDKKPDAEIIEPLLNQWVEQLESKEKDKESVWKI